MLADECTDVNSHEMLSVCIRYIKDGTVIEQFLCATPVVSTTADSIHQKLIEILHMHQLDETKIAAASFDGASNFSGCKGGVQAY